MSKIDKPEFRERDQRYYELLVGEKSHLGLHKIRKEKAIDKNLPLVVPKLKSESDSPILPPSESQDLVPETEQEKQEGRRFPIKVVHAPT